MNGISFHIDYLRKLKTLDNDILDKNNNNNNILSPMTTKLNEQNFTNENDNETNEESTVYEINMNEDDHFIDNYYDEDDDEE
jgi:hypothetical protein